MSDAKFLGLCIVGAALIISSAIVWSTTVSQAARAGQPTKEAVAPTAASSSEMTVKIDGPVTLAPITEPLPVTLTNSAENPVITKEASDKKWNKF